VWTLIPATAAVVIDDRREKGQSVRTLVTFRSQAFNVSEERPHFINPGTFGDDVAKWMIEELEDRGVEVGGEPGQEDFGWYVSFTVGGVAHWWVVGYRPGDPEQEGEWISWVERSRGLLGFLLGRRARQPTLQGVRLVHETLAQSEQIREIHWHDAQQFQRGIEDQWRETPVP
jgi:hypothetical protein